MQPALKGAIRSDHDGVSAPLMDDEALARVVLGLACGAGSGLCRRAARAAIVCLNFGQPAGTSSSVADSRLRCACGAVRRWPLLGPRSRKSELRRSPRRALGSE